MASMYQTAAMTSCCSLANLTLASTTPDADGKRMWSVDGSRWARWKEALAEVGCSAGLEGQDPRARSPGVINWYNMSVCGPRALCMPYNPVAANTTSWAFTCACTFGEAVDPTSPPADGVWNPSTLCTTLNASGWFAMITYCVNTIFYLGVLVYAIDTFVRLRMRSSKGCCAQKLTFEVAGNILQFALLATSWSMVVAEWGMRRAGIDHHPLEEIKSYFYAPLIPVAVINALVVAVTCTIRCEASVVPQYRTHNNLHMLPSNQSGTAWFSTHIRSLVSPSRHFHKPHTPQPQGPMWPQMRKHSVR